MDGMGGGLFENQFLTKKKYSKTFWQISADYIIIIIHLNIEIVCYNTYSHVYYRWATEIGPKIDGFFSILNVSRKV